LPKYFLPDSCKGRKDLLSLQIGNNEMAKKNIGLSAFPEKEEKKGSIRIYGEKSYAEQMAVLTHYLHNGVIKGNDEKAREIRAEIRCCITDYLEHKGLLQNFSDNQIEQVAENPLEGNLFSDFMKVPFPAPLHPDFTFIDLFAGIGGFRIAMQNLGGKCVYSSEFDAKAQESYLANYGEMPFGDITKESTKSYIPKDFDVLCAGFPCQSFSLAGKHLGFADETRGTLFFEVEDVLRKHQPKAFFLENVKGLAIHDHGKTLATILEHLKNAGYDVVPPQILNAMDFGVPQHRERIYIVGFRHDLHINVDDFHYPEPTTPEGKRVPFKSVMEKHEVSVKYYLFKCLCRNIEKAQGPASGGRTWLWL
jgi:DNA (cytosine-5)-methyltransferase 1